MFLFLFLSLGQVYASQGSADRIYQCTLKKARMLTAASVSQNFSLKEITEDCQIELGADDVSIEEASISGTIHKLKLKPANRTKSLVYFFNVRGSKLCNSSPSSSKPNINSFIIDMENVLTLTKNSAKANSCSNSEKDPAGTLFGLGFKEVSKNDCQRICPSGQVFKGDQVPIIYRDEKGTSSLSGLKINNTEIFLNTECVFCPTKDKPNYTNTNPYSNSCYDSDGCKEGYKYDRKATEESGIPSIINPKKFCVSECEKTQSLKDGECTPDPKKLCEEYRNAPSKIDNWLAQFSKLSQTSKIGTCDMNTIRKEAVEWAGDQKERITDFLAHKCPEDEVFSLGAKFEEKILAHPKLQKCFMKITDGSYDARIYILMGENVFGNSNTFEVYE